MRTVVGIGRSGIRFQGESRSACERQNAANDGGGQEQLVAISFIASLLMACPRATPTPTNLARPGAATT